MRCEHCGKDVEPKDEVRLFYGKTDVMISVCRDCFKKNFTKVKE